MERALLQLAQKLSTCDEASLVDLWTKYALLVQNFEPTKLWEERTLVFCLLQAVVWKNKLFNVNLLELQEHSKAHPSELANLFLPDMLLKKEEKSEKPMAKATVLPFSPRDTTKK